MAAANNSLPQNALSQSYKRAASQDTADRYPTSPSRETETGHPHQGPGGLEALFSAPSTPRHLPASRVPPLHLLSRAEPPPRFKTSANILTSPKTLTHSSLTYHHWVGIHSVQVQVVTIHPSDTVGPSSPSHAPPPGGSLSNRRKASLNAINPPAKRSRRVLQPNATGNAVTQVGSTDQSLGQSGPTARGPEGYERPRRRHSYLAILYI